MNKNQKIIALVLARIFDENKGIPIDMNKIKADVNEYLVHDNRDVLGLNEDEIYKIEKDIIDIFIQLKRII